MGGMDRGERLWGACIRGERLWGAWIGVRDCGGHGSVGCVLRGMDRGEDCGGKREGGRGFGNCESMYM